MADKQIIDLPLKATPDGTELLEIQEAVGGVGSSKKVNSSTITVGTATKLTDFNKHGITSGCVFSVNGGDANTYDVSAGTYYVNGAQYDFAGVTARPSVGLAGTFASVGLNASGIFDKSGGFIDLDDSDTDLEVTTYAKLTDTTIDVVGESQDNYLNFMKNSYLRQKFFAETLFKNGAGKITASSTSLQMDIAAGSVNAPNSQVYAIAGISDFGALPMYNVAGTEQLNVLINPFIAWNDMWDNGTDLVLINDTTKYVTHTVSMSMRTGTKYVTAGKTLYDSLGAAESATPDLGIFENTEEGSFIEPLALVICKDGQPDFQEIIDVRGGKIATTIDAIAGQTILNPVSGDVMTYNGTQWVSQTPASNAGQGVSYFLGDNIISGGNFDLTIAPAGGPEVEVVTTANSGDSPQFVERYVSDALGGTNIDAGAWTFLNYASVSANAGNSNLISRVNKSVLKAGTITSTGTGQTRTFTATEAGTFVSGDADASILNATLIQTPTETFWIDTFISDTVVTATTDGAGYVNESAVAFDMYYKLFDITNENITGSTPALYEKTTVQPAFPINVTDKLLVAYFITVSSGTNKTITLYKNGTENYSHFLTPLIYRHNNLAGLNEDDYKHLTAAEYNTLTSGGLDAGSLHNHSAEIAAAIALLGDGETIVTSVSQTAHGLLVGDVIKSSGIDGEYDKAQSDSSANAEAVGIVTAVADGNNFTYTTGGHITVAAAVLNETAGTTLFLDPAVSGGLTATEPVTAGQISKPMAIVTTDNAEMLLLQMRGIEVAATESTVITTKGDLIVGDTAGGPVRKGVGTESQVLKADPNDADGVSWQDNFTGLKNHIINGGFDISQREDIDSAPVAMVNGAYQIDRFITRIATVTGTIQRLSNQVVNNKSVNTLKHTATSTGTGLLGGYQKIENFFKGETKTFSAWIKSNSSDARLVINDGVSISSSNAHSGGGEYELLTVTKTISASATMLVAYFNLATSSNSSVSITSGDYIETTMIQSEQGETATNFEQRPVGMELGLCQRYFTSLDNVSGTGMFGAGSANNGTTTVFLSVVLPNIMRVEPTLTYGGAFDVADGSAGSAVSSLSILRFAANTAEIQAVTSGVTAYRPYRLISNSSDTFINFDAEL